MGVKDGEAVGAVERVGNDVGCFVGGKVGGLGVDGARVGFDVPNGVPGAQIPFPTLPLPQVPTWPENEDALGALLTPQ